MARNTFVLVSALAVTAALIIGVNLGRKMAKQPQTATSIEESLSPLPTVQPTPTLEFYENKYCGVSLNYPNNFSFLESASGSAVFTNLDNPKDSFLLTCQNEIPRPALSGEKIETLTLASTSAKLYHDASAKDGTPIDKLIFRHPTKRLDVLISGFSTTFQDIIQSLTILE